MLDQLFLGHCSDPKFWDSLYFLAILQCLILPRSGLLELKLLQALPHFPQRHLDTHLMAYRSYKCINALLRARSILSYLFFYLNQRKFTVICMTTFIKRCFISLSLYNHGSNNSFLSLPNKYFPKQIFGKVDHFLFKKLER